MTNANVTVTVMLNYSKHPDSPANGNEVHVHAESVDIAGRIAKAAVRLYGGHCWTRDGYGVYAPSYHSDVDIATLDFGPAIAKVQAEEKGEAKAAIARARRCRLAELRDTRTADYGWDELLAHVTEIASVALRVTDATPVTFYAGGGSGGNAYYDERPLEACRSAVSKGEHFFLRKVTFVSEGARVWCDVYRTVGSHFGDLKISGWEASPTRHLPGHPDAAWNEPDTRR